MTFFTPITDSELGKAEAVNRRLRQIEASIDALDGVMVEIAPWTTLAANATSIPIDIPPGYSGLTVISGLRTNRVGSVEAVKISVNDETVSDYRVREMMNGSANANNAADGWLIDYSAATSDSLAGMYSYMTLRIAAPSTSVAKLAQFDVTTLYLTSSNINFVWGSAWTAVASTITSLRYTPVLGTEFLAGCHYAVYGMN